MDYNRGIEMDNFNAEISRSQIFIMRLTVFYLITLCFGYSYGITLFGSINLRVSDFIAIFLVLFGLFLLFKINNIYIKPFIPILPFLTLEVILPIIGGVFLVSIQDISSGFRIVLLYMPILLYFFFFGTKALSLFDNMIYKTLQWVVILNLIYCSIQFLVLYSILPENVLLENYLSQWAVDDHYRILDGLRASGFFINSTSLSIFGLISMAYFLSKYILLSGRKNLYFGLTSLILVIASTSRTAYLVALVFIVLVILMNVRKSFKLILVGSVAILVFIIVINNTLGGEEFFSRFIRLDDGLESDYSLGLRMEVIWPYVITNLSSYPVGTLIPPTNVFGVVDSGYLTYYAQGKWMFIISLIFLLILTAYKYLLKFLKRDNWSVIFLIFILIYIFTSMIVSNPLRNPIVIYFLLYALFISYNSFNRNNRKSLK